jgi:hypothetical protein
MEKENVFGHISGRGGGVEDKIVEKQNKVKSKLSK